MNIIEGIGKIRLFPNNEQIYTKIVGFLDNTNNNQQLYKVKTKKNTILHHWLFFWEAKRRVIMKYLERKKYFEFR